MRSFFRFSLLVLLHQAEFAAAKKVVNFDSKNAKDASNLKGLNFVSRIYLPYGLDKYSDNPSQESGDRPFKGYGFGMNAVSELAYDTQQHYLYAGSAQGVVTITDFGDPSNPIVLDVALEVRAEPESMTICDEQGLLFLAFEDDGVVEIYDTVLRPKVGNTGILIPPEEPGLRAVVNVGELPKYVSANSDCSVVAVSNKNDGAGLAQGAVTLIRNVTSGTPSVTRIPFDDEDNPWDDDYALRKGIHMPLTRKALEYWDEHSSRKDELNFTEVRENYKTSIFLRPKVLAWSGANEKELLVMIQSNNGLIRVDVENNRATALVGFGLKDHGVIPIDVNQNDFQCDLKTYPNLFSMRNPEGMQTLNYNGRRYVVTANEGNYGDYEGWDDNQSADDIFDGTTFALDNMEVVPSVFLPGQNGTGVSSAMFNSACNSDDCARGVFISTGSSSIDFELDPTNPKFHRIVLFGGRGWSIFEVPEDPDDLLKLVFDSKDDAERTSCQKFPWAYNAVAEEEMAPTENFPNNTLWRLANANETYDEDLIEELLENSNPEEKGCEDRGDGFPGACPMGDRVDKESIDYGPAFENIAVGVACGRLVSVIATEKSALVWLYDITNMVRPTLIKVFSVSPVSETKSPGVAYNEGTLGELNMQHYFILDASESPTGKAAVVFDGSASGTVSYWEFECGEPDDPSATESTPTDASIAPASPGFYCIFASALIGFLLMS